MDLINLNNKLTELNSNFEALVIRFRRSVMGKSHSVYILEIDFNIISENEYLIHFYERVRYIPNSELLKYFIKRYFKHFFVNSNVTLITIRLVDNHVDVSRRGSYNLFYNGHLLTAGNIFND